jgi:uncharacterized membrane protein YsdA (DUF1294 family)/cold shock CspA family protein
MAEKLKLPSIQTGTIVEWRDAQGFGFLELGNARVFLHRREFAAFHKTPEVGDRIRFSIGLDKVGRTCAKSATHLNDGGKFGIGALAVLMVLLVLPAVALCRLAMPLAFSFGYFGIASIFAYGVYAADKGRARRGEWRVSEATLHVVEFIGGWPGAFVAQRRLRHKCTKGPYQFVFWVIVFAHQFIALDFVWGWALVRSLRAFF